MEKTVLTICVYGDFAKKDVRIKIFHAGDSRQFSFQNILHDAGYDASLFTVNNTDVPFLQEVQK